MTNDETTCPECAETIKAAAKVCKHCGYRHAPETVASSEVAPQREELKSDLPREPLEALRIWIGIGAIVIVLAITATFAFIVSSVMLDREHPHVQVAGIDYIKKDLLDPSSVQFRNLYATDRCLTGDINAKNSFGAYTGFTSFYYDDRTKKGRLEPVATDGLTGPPFFAYLKDSEAYSHESSVCLLGESVTADNDAKVAKDLAKQKAR